MQQGIQKLMEYLDENHFGTYLHLLAHCVCVFLTFTFGDNTIVYTLSCLLHLASCAVPSSTSGQSNSLKVCLTQRLHLLNMVTK